MDPALIAIWSSIGISLSGGIFSVFAAMRESTDPGAKGDSAVPILFGTAMLLIVLIIAAAAAIAVGGVAYLDLLRGALALTAGFAVVCTVIGFMRGMRRGRAIETRPS